MMWGMTEDELKAVVPDYEAAAERLLEERDAKLRRARDEGWRQVDIIKVTGLARETVRQALNPEIRAAVKQAAAARRAAKREG